MKLLQSAHAKSVSEELASEQRDNERNETERFELNELESVFRYELERDRLLRQMKLEELRRKVEINKNSFI